MVDLDKVGNATLTNHKISLKTFSETVIVTSNYTFDIANEILTYGSDKIDLKKIIGSSNAYTKEDLVPGDLVFWSHKPNGRFMNITHVGVYAGNGKVIDAAYSKGQVVYRDLFDSNKQVLYGRPHILK